MFKPQMHCSKQTADMHMNIQQYWTHDNKRMLSHLHELLTCGSFDPEMEIQTYESPVEDFIAQAAVTCKIFKKQEFDLDWAIRSAERLIKDMAETKRFFEDSFEKGFEWTDASISESNSEVSPPVQPKPSPVTVNIDVKWVRTKLTEQIALERKQLIAEKPQKKRYSIGGKRPKLDSDEVKPDFNP